MLEPDKVTSGKLVGISGFQNPSNWCRTFFDLFEDASQVNINPPPTWGQAALTRSWQQICPCDTGRGNRFSAWNRCKLFTTGRLEIRLGRDIAVCAVPHIPVDSPIDVVRDGPDATVAERGIPAAGMGGAKSPH
jgi:hypothetical protein